MRGLIENLYRGYIGLI